MLHILKTWPEYFEAVLDERKRFEVREDDRGFAVGDTLALQEWNPETGEHTGRSIDVRVTYLVKGGPFLPDSTVCMSIRIAETPV